MDKQGQNRYNQEQNRDSRDKKGQQGQYRDKTETVMARSTKTKVLDFSSLSLFSPFLVCPWFFSLLGCPFLSLFFLSFVFVSFFLVLSLLFQRQAGTVPFCPCLSLPVPICACLSCLSLSVPVCPCVSLSAPVCPFLSLSVPVCPCLSQQQKNPDFRLFQAQKRKANRI